jgi:hypothetical protein
MTVKATPTNVTVEAVEVTVAGLAAAMEVAAAMEDQLIMTSIAPVTVSRILRAQALLDQKAAPGHPQIIMSSSTLRALRQQLSGTLLARTLRMCTHLLHVALRDQRVSHWLGGV